jgi:hypothetical protein
MRAALDLAFHKECVSYAGSSLVIEEIVATYSSAEDLRILSVALERAADIVDALQ